MQRATGEARRRGAVVVACLLAAAAWLPADGARAAEFSAALDRNRVSQSQPVRLTLRFSRDAPIRHLPSPAIDLSQFVVIGPSVMEMETRDQRGSQYSRELVYTLYARQPGTFQIGPARLQVDGETLSTETLQLEVARGAAPRQGASPDPKQGQAAERTLEDNLFIRVQADRDTAYVGQQVGVRFDLCYRYNLRNPRFAEVPTYPGFWVKELFVAPRLEPQRETIDGVSFHVAPLRHVALFPTSAGSQVVDPMGLTCSVVENRSRGSLFDALSLIDDPIFGRSRTLMVRSDPVTIQVLPLPEPGRPPGFAGAVGEFGVSIEAQPRQVRVGDPVTVRVEIVGTGNVQSVPVPDLGAEGFEVYEPKVELEEGRSADGGYGARRTFEYILIPERGGRLQIPAVAVPYFDPASGAYRTASTTAIEIRSEGDDAAVSAADAYNLTRSEIEQLGRDIRHIKPDVEALGTEPPLYRRTAYWLAHALLPVAYLGLVAWHRHRRRLIGDVAYARRRQARRQLARRLADAGERVDGGDGFHAAVQEAVVAFIADQLNRPAPGLQRDRCRRELAARRLPAALVERVDSLLERCEFGRYAPAASDCAARQGLLAEAEQIVAQLQDALS